MELGLIVVILLLLVVTGSLLRQPFKDAKNKKRGTSNKQPAAKSTLSAQADLRTPAPHSPISTGSDEPRGQPVETEARKELTNSGPISPDIKEKKAS